MNRTTNARLFLALGVLACTVVGASAQTPLKSVVVATGLDNPLFVTHAPGDFERIFIVEQGLDTGVGKIRIMDLATQVVKPTPFLTIAPVVNTGVEQGLLGLAFHPDYDTNGYFYIYHTAPGPGDGYATFTRYKVSGDPDVADPLSAQVFLKLQSVGISHNGGWLGFGPDGYLYVALGDNTDFMNGQSVNTLRAKILRLDVNGDAFPADPERNYAIPPSNPFVGLPGEDEIWTFGLRNPWRCSFDRLTGDLWIGDVGQAAYEEISFRPAPGSPPYTALNYGWICYDGPNCTGLFDCGPTCNIPNYVPAVHYYEHGGNPFRCAVTGGYVYRGCAIPDLQGSYFFADYCSAQIWTMRYNGTTVTEFIDRSAQLHPGGGFGLGTIASFGEDAFGELYVCNLGEEYVMKIVPQTPVGPDCNANGQRDACDILSGFSPDVNANGIPDECEKICYPDCNNSGSLTVADFGCFQGKYVLGDPYADCNASGTLTVADFGCFQGKYVVGCP
ncbi:MAG: PQQ-dependent sugar dehydrogenase [Phycisphaerales bacterium]